MRVYEALAAALVEEGIDTVFGLIGGHVDQLIRVLVDVHKIKYVPVRHEEVAVGMADGYSRVTGKIGVAIVCYGPGLANSAAPMIAARMSQSKLLVIIGGIQGVSIYSNQSYDEPPLIRATIGDYWELRQPRTLAEDLSLALHHIRSGAGPSALRLTEPDAEMPPGWRYIPHARAKVGADPVCPAQDEIRRLADAIQASERPVILAGRGAVKAGARNELITLAAHCGGLLSTSLLARDWFNGDPFNVGLSGGFATADAAEILSQADLVIAFGASLNDYTLAHGHLYQRARIFQIDSDPTAINYYNKVDGGVIGDARLTAQALLIATPEIAHPAWRGKAMAAQIAGTDRWRTRDVTERPGTANPRRVIDECDAELPLDRTLVIDIGDFMAIPAAYMRVASPDGLVFPWQLGRVGCGLPVALGAAAGRSDRQTVLFVGDGGFMAALHALDTAKDLNAPVLILVMDDGGFGAERRVFRLSGVSSGVGDYKTPDLAAVARSLGVHGYTARSSDEARRAIREYRRHGGVGLLHVIVDRSVPETEIEAALNIGAR